MPFEPPGPLDPRLRPDRLPDLYEAVNLARRNVAEQRAVRGLQPLQTVAAQEELVAALESYATALEAARRPVPYRLRDELRLYQGLVRPASRPPGGARRER